MRPNGRHLQDYVTILTKFYPGNIPVKNFFYLLQIRCRYGTWYGIFVFHLCAAICSIHPLTSTAAESEKPAYFDHLPFPMTARTSSADSYSGELYVVGYDDYRDPLIKMNRFLFQINDKFYRFLLIPISEGYMKSIPHPARRCVKNFFYNLKTPIYLVNHLLQWEPRLMGRDLMRFGVNTTVGILGLFDPSQSWLDMERKETHLEDTLADYGAGYGIYLVLPLLGPTDLRNGISTVGEYFLNPVPYLTDYPVSTFIESYDYFQSYAPQATKYETLSTKSEDPYIFFRNLYLQGVQRDADFQ